MEQTQAKIEEIHEKLGENALAIEAVTDRLNNADYLTVLQYCQRQGLNVTASVRQKWGKQASELSRGRGVEIGETIEGDYSVHKYHKSILMDVCVAKPKVPTRQLRLPKSAE